MAWIGRPPANRWPVCSTTVATILLSSSTPLNVPVSCLLKAWVTSNLNHRVITQSHSISSASTPDGTPYCVFLHATTRDDKHWPESHWRELIGLLQESGLRIKLPWGAPHEEARAQRLAQGFDYVDVLPRLSLEKIAHVLAEAKFVVSVDTGLSHLTAALDRPNITLYGPTDPGLIGGYGKNQVACCSESKDLATLNAPAVLRELQKILSGNFY